MKTIRVRIAVPCVLASLLTSTQAANIGWISFHGGDNAPSAAAAGVGFTQAPDAGYTALLSASGHNVTRIVTADNAGLSADTLNGYDLLIISRSVPSGHYQAANETAFWNGIKAPTMIMGGYIMRNSRLGYTTGGTIPDTAGPIGLKATDSTHPIFAGISLNQDGVMANSFAGVVTTTVNGAASLQRGISVNTDPLAGGGAILATIATAGDPASGGTVIAEWQAGATMATGAADVLGGHRLVFLSGSREASGVTSELAGIYDLQADGASMFLNAVNYMAVPEPSVLALCAPALLLLASRFRRR